MLVLNTNRGEGPQFNNDFLLYYRDFNQYLFLPDRSVNATSGQTPSNLTAAFSQNGTPVNTLCQRVLTSNQTSTAITLSGKSPVHTLPSGRSYQAVSNEDMGTIRLGDINQFMGGEKFSEIWRQGKVGFTLDPTSSSSSNFGIQNPDCTVKLKPGLLHTDGTITYMTEIDVNWKANTNNVPRITIVNGDMLKSSFTEVEAQPLDRFICDVNGKINSLTFANAWGQQKDFSLKFLVEFTTDAPFMQLFIN